MFCQNCGSEIADGNNFCHNCGMGAAQDVGVFKPKRRLNKKKIRIIACITAAVVAVSTFLAVTLALSNDSYEEVAEKYIITGFEGDELVGYELSLLNPLQYKGISNKLTADNIDVLYEKAQKRKEEARKDMLDQYGDYDISVGFLRTEEIELKTLYQIMETYFSDGSDNLYKKGESLQSVFSQFGMDINKIDQSVYMLANVSIKGTKDELVYSTEMILVRYDGEWKVCLTDAVMGKEEIYEEFLK